MIIVFCTAFFAGYAYRREHNDKILTDLEHLMLYFDPNGDKRTYGKYLASLDQKLIGDGRKKKM